MVLDNATDTMQDEFVREDRFDGGESSTTSRIPFTVNAPGHGDSTVVLDFDKIPVNYRPQVRDRIARHVINKCQMASVLVARPLKNEEVQAYLEHEAVSESSRKIGNRLGAFGAIAWASWTSYQISKRGPTQTQQASPSTTPQIQRLMQFKNPYVRPWVVCGIMIMATFPLVAFQINGAQYIREMKDPRLEGVRRALVERGRQRQQIENSSSTTQPETFEQRRQRMNTQEMIRRSRGREQSSFGGDDASPTAAGAAEKAWNDVAFEPSNTDSRDQGRVTSAIAARRERAPASTSSSTNDFGNDFYDFGDSSTPPASSSPSPKPASSPTSQSGSTWERLRQDAFNNNRNDK